MGPFHVEKNRLKPNGSIHIKLYWSRKPLQYQQTLAFPPH